MTEHHLTAVVVQLSQRDEPPALLHRARQPRHGKPLRIGKHAGLTLLLHDPSLSPDDAKRAATSALWTFPSILASAFVVAWAAEAAQFYVSQGLALAVLAWVQVLPEFAVEAAIAWQRDVPLMTANFTGALRLLTGLGWPVIWVVFAVSRRLRGERGFFARIELDEEHAVEVVGLVPALLYFAFVIAKGSLGNYACRNTMASKGGRFLWRR